MRETTNTFVFFDNFNISFSFYVFFRYLNGFGEPYFFLEQIPEQEIIILI